jgi:hypothetical protein
MVPAARNAPSSLALTQHSNRVSANAGLRCGELTEQQQRARRARSIAIAVSLGVLVLLFYIVKLVKGPAVLVRP